MANAMKNMDVGDIWPWQVDDDSDIHMINQEVQIDTNQASTSGSHDDDQNQSQASGSNQLPKSSKYSKTSSIGSSHWWHSKWCTNKIKASILL